MKIQEMSEGSLAELAKKVEGALAQRATKSQIIKTLSEQELCSPKSAGFEKTYIKVLKEKNVKIPPLTAKLMGETVDANFFVNPSAIRSVSLQGKVQFRGGNDVQPFRSVCRASNSKPSYAVVQIS